MFKLTKFWSVCCSAFVLLMSVLSASAETLTFSGANYTSVDYYYSDQNDWQFIGFEQGHSRGSYTADMSVSLNIELEGTLLPSTFYTFNSRGGSFERNFDGCRASVCTRDDYLPHDGSETVNVLSYQISDGLNNFKTHINPDAFAYGSTRLVTDARGQVQFWDISHQNGGGADMDRLRSITGVGDHVSYGYEFAGIHRATRQFSFLGEQSRASTTGIGAWSGMALMPAVPLPASLSLMLAGMGCLGAMRRRARRRA